MQQLKQCYYWAAFLLGILSLAIIIWHNVVFQMNNVNPLLQSSDVTVDMIAEIYANCRFLQNSMLCVCCGVKLQKKIALRKGLSHKCVTKTKCLFDYEFKHLKNVSIRIFYFSCWLWFVFS